MNINWNQTLAVLVILLVLGGVAYLLTMAAAKHSPSAETPAPGQGICTQDAKLCPDGSYVGRVSPSCEFAACPGATATTSVQIEL